MNQFRAISESPKSYSINFYNILTFKLLKNYILKQLLYMDHNAFLYNAAHEESELNEKVLVTAHIFYSKLLGQYNVVSTNFLFHTVFHYFFR